LSEGSGSCPRTGPVGTPITVTGEDFPAGQDLDLVWATVTGSWKVSIYDPAGVAPAAWTCEELYDLRRDAEGVPYNRAAERKQPPLESASAAFGHILLNQAGATRTGSFFGERAGSWAGLHLVGVTFDAQAEEARPVPRGPGDGAGNGREAGKGLLLPDEAVEDDGHGVAHVAVFSHQDDGSGLEPGAGRRFRHDGNAARSLHIAAKDLDIAPHLFTLAPVGINIGVSVGERCKRRLLRSYLPKTRSARK
jgi:hypothetical protein